MLTQVRGGAAAEEKHVAWTIVYHGDNLKGRAEPLRLVLECAGVPYQESGEKIMGPGCYMDAFRESLEAVATQDDQPWPVMFPPVIWHRPRHGKEVFVNQMVACVQYIASMVGYAPRSPDEAARANQIALNAADFLNEGNLSFHPVDKIKSYYDQKEEGDKASKAWCQKRAPVYLQHFNKVVKRVGRQSFIAGGPTPTHADFLLFHVLDAFEGQFNNDFYGKAWDQQNVADLKAWKAWFASQPNLKAYLASKRRKPWAGASMM